MCSLKVHSNLTSRQTYTAFTFVYNHMKLKDNIVLQQWGFVHVVKKFYAIYPCGMD
jgi:hypothetical protein